MEKGSEKITNKGIIFGVLLSGCILSSAIQTALNTALAPIMQEMSIQAGTAQWLASIYSLVMGVIVLATGFLIKRIPNRTLFITSMALFDAGLLLSAVAPVFAVLLIGRILQAAGCGILMSLTQVILLSMYPASKRGTIMGIYGLAVCATPILAPTAAGFIIDSSGWRTIFMGAFVIGIIILALGIFLMKNISETRKLSFDLLSFSIGSAGFTLLVIALGNWSRSSFFSFSVIGLIVIGILLILVFIYRQTHIAEPFLHMEPFKDKNFRWAVITSVLLYCIMMAGSTLIPLYIQSYRGLSAVTYGLVAMPGSIITAVCSFIGGKLYDKLGIRKIYVIASAFVIAGNLPFAFLNETTSPVLVSVVFALRSVGIGLLMMNVVTWGMSRLESQLIADGTALISSMRTIAGAAGSAVFVSIMTIAAKGSSNPEMIHGVCIAFLVLTIMSAFMMIIGLAKTEAA